MSYAKFRDMVELCGHLQARSMGLTITELMQLTEHSRKTVERMLGTLSKITAKLCISRQNIKPKLF